MDIPTYNFLYSAQIEKLIDKINTYNKPSIISICGGSCAGKTTLAKYLAKQTDAAILSMDAYYRNIQDIPEYLPGLPAFDSPAAFDLNLLGEHLKLRLSGKVIESPVYEYSKINTGRNPYKKKIIPSNRITIFDGILSYFKILRSYITLSIFVDRDEIERRKARITRDIAERGVTLERSIYIYDNMTVPLFSLHVLPQRMEVDVIISNY